MASNSEEADVAILQSIMDEDFEEPKPLTPTQKAKIERSRQKALLLKQARLANQPYTKTKSERTKAVPRVIDTLGGFLLELDSEDPKEKQPQPVNIVHPPGAIIPTTQDDFLICDECDKDFLDSYLYSQFDAPVCDNCRDDKEKHRLITRTEAKDTYLLKDVDLDKREPVLKFITRKNPRNDRWGDMKLYLEIKVAERAMLVWESEENLEAERELRQEKRDKAKQKKYDKKVKELRKAVRSSLWKKDDGAHQHEFGEETYDEEEDSYSKTCNTCGHTMTYEKM